ncbi:chitobiase/beta-hexosaminidase C-terminal domain-containing protein [Pyxidicoccus trucidator]|uniref:chitobiase/beta-hexosaminidase C-terminal domain-containing protein n=1 Tax=Pyxidicoccus trucidator TaxID=2709662 RepID=UPI0013DAC7DD|nr:chitobiase/beta-hexosaminidase C-terminal domain-containing protein [Pyxidicoccus trucidator]
MRLKTSWPLRCALGLLITQFVLACGDGGGDVDGGVVVVDSGVDGGGVVVDSGVDGGGGGVDSGIDGGGGGVDSGVDGGDVDSGVDGGVDDTAAPSTRATPVGGSFTSAVAVTLACDDGAGSGCSATYYTLDGSTPGTGSTLYREPFTLGAPATLRFFSVDEAGNAEAAKTETYVIDTTVPTVSANPGGGTFFSPRTVTLSCNDTGTGCAGIHYTTDGSVPGTGSTRYTAALDLSSNTTLRFIGVDGVGNTSTVVTETYTFVTDTTAPVTTIAPPPGTYTSSRNVTLTCTDNEGGSGCDGTFYTLDGSEPTTDSTRYTGAFTLSASTTVRFFSVDAAGNAETAQVAVYTLDFQAPVTVATPPGDTYPDPTVTVTLTCSDSGTGCGATRYTTDGSLPGGASALYTGPFTLARSATVRFFSVDLAGNVEPVVDQSFALPNSSGETASAQIAAVRTAADGLVSLPIDGAYITFVKPGVGSLANDPAGFFLQAERGGPALFVEVDPAGLSPEPQAGMRVSIVVNSKRVTNGMVRATLSSFGVQSTGQVLTGFVQDVSQVDLPASLPDYESELITLTGTLNGPFSLAGAGHEQAPLVTARVPAGSPSAFNFRLRVVETVREQLDLVQGCTVRIVSPLWFFSTGTGTPLTQPSVWAPEQLVSSTCPGPRVTGGLAAGPETVIVRFDRRIDPASVLADGSQFSIAGLTVTGASASGNREVRLDTSLQTPRQLYTVAVASTVRDAQGKGVEPTGRTGSFRGWKTPAVLRITELAPGVSNQRDLVELVVLQGGSTEGITLADAASSTPLATLPDVEVLAGELIVIHLNPDRVTAGVDAPGSELTSKTAWPQAQYSSNFDTAWDFQGGTFGISGGQRVHRIRDPLGNTQDALAAVIPGFIPIAAYPDQLQALQAEGQWSPADCNGVPCTYESFPSAFDVSFDWSFAFPVSGTKTTTVGRVSSWDTDTASDWALGPATLGVLNGAVRE